MTQPKLNIVRPGESGPDEQEPTVLLSLKDRLAKKHDELFIDLRIPRWEDPPFEVWIRCRPVGQAYLNAQMKKRSALEGKDEEWPSLLNADLLVEYCEGVYAKRGDEKLSLKPGAPYGPWTRFDPDLAANLGLPADVGAVHVCRTLFLTDFDLASAANKLIEWSGFAREMATDDFLENLPTSR